MNVFAINEIGRHAKLLTQGRRADTLFQGVYKARQCKTPGEKKEAKRGRMTARTHEVKGACP